MKYSIISSHFTGICLIGSSSSVEGKQFRLSPCQSDVFAVVAQNNCRDQREANSQSDSWSVESGTTMNMKNMQFSLSILARSFESALNAAKTNHSTSLNILTPWPPQKTLDRRKKCWKNIFSLSRRLLVDLNFLFFSLAAFLHTLKSGETRQDSNTEP